MPVPPPSVSHGPEPRGDTATSITTRLDELFEGLDGCVGTDGRIELLESFRRRVAEEMELIDAAIGADDDETLASRAHSVKGMAGNVGAPHLASAAGVVEDAARDGRLAEVPTAAAVLRGAVEHVDEVVVGVLAALGPVR